jgi:hypothetical protein
MNNKQLIDTLREFMRLNSFPENKEPYRINLAGVRTSYEVSKTDGFDDTLCVWRYTESGELQYIVGDGTTLAGLYYATKELLNPEGVAIISEGYHKDLWVWAYHHDYEAFKQNASFSGFRDKNKDYKFDLNNPVLIQKTACVNMHHAGSNTSDTKTIGRNSAGCQVWEQMADWIRVKTWGKKDHDIYKKPFSYLCISRDDVNKTFQIMNETPPTLPPKPEAPEAVKIETPVIEQPKAVIIETPQTQSVGQKTPVKHLSIIEIIMKLLQFFKK